MRIIRIRTDEPPTVAEIDGYEAMSAEVGGLIEPVDIFDHIDGGAILWVNEEGKLIGLPFNPYAHELAHLGEPYLAPNDHIMGNVFVTGPTDDDGYSTDAPLWLIESLGLEVSA